MTPRSLVNR